ncbi:hypothetical protein B566_EDAN009267 [Ephemera danica]|nr:hypothetical protein B566_EDAN009267 [Ephemera danica]
MACNGVKTPLKMPDDLTNENVKEMLQAQLDALNEPENAKRLKDVRDDCKNEAMRVMCYLFPQVVAIQTRVLGNFGVVGTQGLIQFITHVKEMMKDDPEIERLYRELQTKTYLDPHF